MSERPHDLPPEKHTLYIHARQIMGRPGGAHWELAHRYLLDYSWREDEVRQVVDAPEDVEWFTRVLELEYRGLADFRFYKPPNGSGSDSFWGEEGQWRDQPLETWGEFYIRAVSWLSPGVMETRLGRLTVLEPRLMLASRLPKCAHSCGLGPTTVRRA